MANDLTKHLCVMKPSQKPKRTVFKELPSWWTCDHTGRVVHPGKSQKLCTPSHISSNWLFLNCITTFHKQAGILGSKLFLSSVCHSSKLKQRRGSQERPICSGWSEALVTTIWGLHLASEAGVGISLGQLNEPFTYGIWCYLLVDNIRIALNSQWIAWEFFWWCGRGSTHTLELGLGALREIRILMGPAKGSMVSFIVWRRSLLFPV